MKVNIKYLKGEIFSIQMQEQQTIADLKQMIECQKGIAAEIQRLFLKAKTVKNDEILGNLGMKGRDYLVLGLSQALGPPYSQLKPQSKEKLEEKVEEKVEHSPEPVERKQQKKQEIKRERRAASPPNEDQINQIMQSMGFERQQTINALRLTNNNSIYAVEYLMYDILPQTPQNSSQSSPENSPENGPNSQYALSALTAILQFSEIRAAIERNHGSLPHMLAQLVNTSPQLYNIVIQHPEQFQQLIAEGGQEGEQSLQIGQFKVQEDPVKNQGNQQERVISQDQNAIERLQSLGFSRLQVVIAYYDCDKNEEEAGNLLYDRLANGEIGNGFSYRQRGLSEDEDEDRYFDRR